MTNSEFSSRMESPSSSESNFACSNKQPNSTNVPDAWDWVAKGAISTKVVNIDKCEGGSYGVVAAETITAGRFITTGKLIETSSMQIIECSQSKGNNGCTGGNILNSFEYVLSKGVTS